jgi:hypothetical protein
MWDGRRGVLVLEVTEKIAVGTEKIAVRTEKMALRTAVRRV